MNKMSLVIGLAILFVTEFGYSQMRTFQIPRGRGGMGQPNVWYASNDSNQFKDEVVAFLKSDGTSARHIHRTRRKGLLFGRNADPLLRQRIERKAILAVSRYFTKLGYTIASFEKDNLGWDLQAHLSSEKSLRLEVKGLSGDFTAAELTPNEFYNMQKYSSSYRICIVADTLRKPRISVFSYSPELNRWEDGNRHFLRIRKVVSARLETQ